MIRRHILGYPFSARVVLFVLVASLSLDGIDAWGQGRSRSTGPGVNRPGRGADPGISGRVPPAPPPGPNYPTAVPTAIRTADTPSKQNFASKDGGFYEPQVVLDPASFSGAVIGNLAFSPSGQFLAVAGDAVRIWDIQATPPQLVHTLRGQKEFGGVGNCTDVAYSPDGRNLLVAVSGYNASLRVYDTSDYSQIKEVYGGHDGYIVRIAFSDDGLYLATAGSDNHIHVWNWPQRTKEKSYRLRRAIAHLSFPCGHHNLLALTDDGDVFYWSLETGAMADDVHRTSLYELYSNCPPVRRGAVHAHATTIRIPDGLAMFGTLERDGNKSRYRCVIWKRNAARPEVEHAHKYFVTASALDHRRRIAASADALGQVHVWSAETGAEIARFKNDTLGIFSVAFDGNSRLNFGRKPYKAGAGWKSNHRGALDEFIDLADWKLGSRPAVEPVPVTRLGNREARLSSGPTFSMRTTGQRNFPTIPFGRSSFYRPLSWTLLDGQELGFADAAVVGFSNGVICAYHPSNLQLQRTFLGHLDRVWGMSQSPDGRLLATCSGDNTIRIWSLTAGRRLGNLAAYVEDDGTIYHVVSGTPTAQALRVGDTLLEMDGQSFSRIAEQFAARGQWSYRPGQRVPVKFRRGSHTQQATIALSNVGDIVEPLLNILVAPDGKDWIAWTQPGYYTSSALGDRLIGWQVNQGRTQAAKMYYVDQFREKFYRPDVVELALRTTDVMQAVELANAEFANPPAPLDIRTDIQSLRPPTVNILEPVSGARLTSSKVVVRAEIKPANDAPILEVTVLVNGRTYSARNVVIEPTEGSNQTTEFEQTVQLSPGTNRIAVHARTAASIGISEEILVSGPSFATVPRLFTVAVGVSEYADKQLNLEYAAKDAGDFVTALRQQQQRGGFAEVHERLLVNAAATRPAVENAIGWLVDETTPNDLVVFFLSSHGLIDKNRNYYAATHETDVDNPRSTCLPWHALHSMVQDIPCRVVLFIDTCHAGGVLGGQRVVFDPYKILTSAEAGAVLFAAAAAGSPGFEGRVNGNQDGNGLFTRALLDTLNDPDSDKDVPKDGYLSLAELEFNLDWRVRQLSAGSQIPVMQRPHASPDDKIFRSLPAVPPVTRRKLPTPAALNELALWQVRTPRAGFPPALRAPFLAAPK